MAVRVGFEKIDNAGEIRLEVNIKTACHWIICGGSGSGKSYFILYALNSILNSRISLYLADFKGSGDYIGLSDKYAEFGEITAFIDEFYSRYTEIKENQTGEHIMLIFDEYAGYLVWLEGHDKKKAAEIKNKISEILMLGRELPGGGSAWVWIVCQRADSTYFSHGARDNFMVSVGMGRLSKESKAMLFPGEDFPLLYSPETGCGVILEDGKPMRIFRVPRFDKNRLKLLLQKKSGA